MNTYLIGRVQTQKLLTAGKCKQVSGAGVEEGERITSVILKCLEAHYGVSEWKPHLNSVDELVSCILSQYTSQKNCTRAFALLKTRFPDWEDVVSVPTKEVADTIRSCGLADSKAPRIQNVLREIKRQRGSINLDFLSEFSDEDARQWLLELPGVGPKTAAIVLCFSMNRPVFAVDTHVFRVVCRLGLIEEKIGLARAHDALQGQIVSKEAFRLHIALITHGRLTCKASSPLCTTCPLKDICRHFQEVRKETGEG